MKYLTKSDLRFKIKTILKTLPTHYKTAQSCSITKKVCFIYVQLLFCFNAFITECILLLLILIKLNNFTFLIISYTYINYKNIQIH